MRDTRRLALVFATLALACAGTQRAKTGEVPPPPERAQDYYPLAEGWKWAYDLERGADRILAVYAVKEVSGETVVMQAGEEQLRFAVLPEGVARKEGPSVSDFILKTPIRAGASWPVNGGRATVVAVGKTVTVGAGNFVNCAVVEETRHDPERLLRTTYAAGVGMVTLEYQVHDLATGKFDMALRATLRGVTRPGEDPLQ